MAEQQVSHDDPFYVNNAVGGLTGIDTTLRDSPPADLYDRVLTVDEAVARELAAPLTREEGIFAGTSSAFNIAGVLRIAQELGPGHTVATVACDSGLKYLAGDLYRT